MGSIMPSSDVGAYMIIAYSLVISLLSLAVIIRYKERTIPMNRYIFVAIFFVGLFVTLFYGMVLAAPPSVPENLGGALGLIHISRIKQVYTLSVFALIVVAALLVRRFENGKPKKTYKCRFFDWLSCVKTSLKAKFGTSSEEGQNE